MIENEVFANETGYLYDKKKTTIAIGATVIILIAISFFSYLWYSSYIEKKAKEENQFALNICSQAKELISNGNLQNATKKFASLSISNDFEQGTKDSINSTIELLLNKNIEAKQTEEISNLYLNFWQSNCLTKSNSILLSEYNVIAEAEQFYNLVQQIRKSQHEMKWRKEFQANDDWKEIIANDLSTDSIINLQYSNPQVLNVLSIDSINYQIASDFESYLIQLLSFKEADGVPCSIENDLKRFEEKIMKLKSIGLSKLTEPIFKKLKQAQEKYKNTC